MKIENILNQKFTVQVTGGEARLLYRRGPENSLDLYSTQVPVEARGQNIAEKLVLEALQFAKDEGVKVIPTCPYVHRWFEKHPEEAWRLLKPLSETRPSHGS
ncbi:GNAT family N-acetyltransferase [Bdellovibrio bacteriovorus]|uniref:GNAT family N-acetyltransferase n=1 Tax=Bdellovibrio bacteriovorus TaxID=959 RepID=UPI0035A6CB06